MTVFSSATVSVLGTARKFNVYPLVLNLASGIAMLSIATVVCDMFVLYVTKRRAFYRQNKYLNVAGDDAFQILQDDMNDAERYASSSGGKDDSVVNQQRRRYQSTENSRLMNEQA